MTQQELVPNEIDQSVAAVADGVAFAASTITTQSGNDAYFASREAQQKNFSANLPDVKFNFGPLEATDQKGDAPAQATPEQKAVGMALSGDMKGLQAQFAALRKDGDIEAEGKLALEIKAQTGLTVSFNGKTLSLSMPSRDTNDSKQGTTVKIDETGKVTASKYDYAMGVTTETPVDDATKVLKDISRQAIINYESKRSVPAEASGITPPKK